MNVLNFLKFKIKIDKRPNLIRLDIIHSHLYTNTLSTYSFYEKLILKHTVISRDHLTPELKLRLITSGCNLWHCKSTDSEFPNDPFWGIYWPGGQALGRYILNNQHKFQQKNILDIGSGSGACAIAAALSGASIVLANDIDPVSLLAININSNLNNVKVEVVQESLIEEDIDNMSLICNSPGLKLKWDIILIGDMFYDSEFSKNLFVWLCKLVNQGKTILVGDPGRHALKDLSQLKDIGILKKIAEYSLKNMEHNGFSSASVYEVIVKNINS